MPPHWNDYPGMLDLDSPEDIAWVKQCGDPLVWHEVAMAILTFRGDEAEFLAWLVEQEPLDRATAMMMFLAQNNGPDILLDRRLHPDQIEGYRAAIERRIRHMVQRLCERDGTSQWPESGIGLNEAWETARQKALEELGDDPRCPKAILGEPVSTLEPRSPYIEIGEGELVSEPWARENMPYMFG